MIVGGISPRGAGRIMGRVRELHGGKIYEAKFGTRMTGQGIWADQMRQRLAIARRRFGLDAQRAKLRCDLFAPPPRSGDQLSLF